MNPKKHSLLNELIILSFLMLSFELNAQDLSQARELCKNLNATNRAIASRAGYDLDQICSAPNTTLPVREVVVPKEKIPRPTVSAAAVIGTKTKQVSETIAPVAVVGMGTDDGPSQLRPFGYDLFANAPTTFAPAESIPVSADYILGPGDTLDILFYGKINNGFSLEINREGFVDFPELGPVGLAGMTYGEAKKVLQARIAAQVVGTKVSITMGSLRTMQIFVLGEAYKPGAYTVSALSTITHALIISGGISDIGSLRNIQLKRSGKEIATLDLYKLLLDGDTSNDFRLQPADVIYIPTIGKLASIGGQVLRPAIYELLGDEDLRELIEIAGGLGPKANMSSASVSRISPEGFMNVIDLDLSLESDLDRSIYNGDHFNVNPIINEKISTVSLVGHVYYPGQFQYKKEMRVSDLLSQIDDQMPGLDLHYAVITRFDKLTGHLSGIKVDLGAILADRGSEQNIFLQDRDILRLFSIDSDRSSLLSPLTNALKRQTRAGELAPIANISGARLPGAYPITKGMTIKDLIDSAGGLRPDYPDLDYALLIREDVNLSGDIEILSVDLRHILSNPRSDKNLTINPKDRLVLFSLNDNRSNLLESTVNTLKSQTRLDKNAKLVNVAGSIKFPGTYPIVENMTIDDLIKAAGGLTESAYRYYAEIARIDLSDPEKAQRRIIQNNSTSFSNVLLKSGDSIQFRSLPEFGDIRKVTLNGEFAFPGSYVIENGETLLSVIERAGGLKDEAFIKGAVFMRAELKAKEQKEIDRLIRLLNKDMTTELLVEANSGITTSSVQMNTRNKALAQLTSIQPIGRLVIPLKDILNSSADDIILKDGDRLIVPKISQEVSIIGEVRRPVSVLFDPKIRQKDYIEKSGGYTETADRRAVYVVKADGDVMFARGGLFRFGFSKDRIEAGDTIVVPLDVDDSRLNGMPLLAEVSTIVYQLALGAAALNTFSND